MKDKKPKTIEDLFKNGFVVTNIVQPYTYEAKEEFIKQIKQLIADEVIALKTNHVNPNCLDSGCCNSHTEVGNVTHDLKKHEEQQRKKLERL